jgi:NADH dehydrogenase (ubiquinone) 1 beta subcomplex subunit 9
MSSRQAALLVKPRGPTIAALFTDLVIRSLYRRSLKLALDWTVHRNLWRGQALYIRSLFEKNRDVTDPRLQRVRTRYRLRRGGSELAWKTDTGKTAQALLKETEKLLEKWKHPDPYCHPTAPGGAHFVHGYASLTGC